MKILKIIAFLGFSWLFFEYLYFWYLLNANHESVDEIMLLRTISSIISYLFMLSILCVLVTKILHVYDLHPYQYLSKFLLWILVAPFVLLPTFSVSEKVFFDKNIVTCRGRNLDIPKIWEAMCNGYSAMVPNGVLNLLIVFIVIFSISKIRDWRRSCSSNRLKG